MALIRLDKLISECGVGTRSEAKTALKKGLISVNGEVVKKGELKVDPATDVVEYKGSRLTYEEFHYYMLHKPAGVVTATKDNIDKTVMDLLKDAAGKDLFPVGRLDKDTEGLLLITDDGELSHRLLSPRHHVDKTYFVRTDGIVSEEDVKILEEGVDIGDEKKTLPAKCVLLKTDEADNISEAELTIREGRFHQVKRMFEAVGKPVIYLKRLSMGSLKLDEYLEKGKYRELTKEEISELKNQDK